MKKSLKVLIPAAAVFIIICGFIINREMSRDVQLRAPKVGDTAPEISLKDPSGKLMKLSDLHGKVVLIDFWASWCKPCRLENPTVVAAYNKYKDTEFKKGKGFTVFSVSLDNNKDAWMAAIKKDGLTWDYHVSDLQGWDSEAARKYDVMSIPSNFLVDSKGKIIAVNLRGPALEQALFNLK